MSFSNIGNGTTWDRMVRRTNVNMTLGEIIRYYYPGMVEVRRVPQAATKWAHWGLALRDDPDRPSDASVQRSCQALFWVSFHWIFPFN